MASYQSRMDRINNRIEEEKKDVDEYVKMIHEMESHDDDNCDGCVVCTPNQFCTPHQHLKWMYEATNNIDEGVEYEVVDDDADNDDVVVLHVINDPVHTEADED